MRILITGGCGFLGSNLASDASKRDDDVLVFDNLYRLGSTANLDWLKSSGGCRFRYGDIRNASDIENCVREFRPEVVFHLAGQVAMTTSIENPVLDFETNAVGTVNLLEALRKYTPTAVAVYSSTNKVYGDLEQFAYEETATRYVCVERPNGFDEQTPLEFHSPYGCSKGAADQYFLDYARVFGMNTVVFRHSSMYGGRQFSSYDQGWIGWFCQQAVMTQAGTLNQPFTISGTGKQVRDVLHAEDMVRLYRAAAGKGGEVRGQVFNIGGGMENSLSLLELFALLEELTGTKLRYVKLAPRASDQKVFVADIRKAERLLDWKPSVSARQGVESMLQWVSNLVAR